MEDRGLKGLLKQGVPWAFVFWCRAHCLTLPLKDGLKSMFFTAIDEFLLQVYFMYEKSPKKCHELQAVVEEVNTCLEPTQMRKKKGGSWPLCTCGTQFKAHKVADLERLIVRFRPYLSCLTAMTEGRYQHQAVDRQKLKGYILKWQSSKILVEFAFLYDLLRVSYRIFWGELPI